MNGSPSSVVTLGFGNGSFSGSVGLVLTLGLGVAEEAVVCTQFLQYTAPLRRMEYTAPPRKMEYAAPER